MKKQIAYSQAIIELQKIIEIIDNEETDLDLVSEKIKQATELIEQCHNKLRQVETDIEASVNKIKNLK
jgi:exodeoxyribonuclease VII small subunit